MMKAVGLAFKVGNVIRWMNSFSFHIAMVIMAGYLWLMGRRYKEDWLQQSTKTSLDEQSQI